MINYNRENQFQALLEVIKPHQKANRTAVPVQDGYKLIPVDQIIFCNSQKEYTFITMPDDEEFLLWLNNKLP